MTRRVVLSLAGIALFLALARILPAAGAPKIENGKKITLFYKLFVEGQLLETADAKEPFTYTHGQKQIVPGLEKGLTGLKVGAQKTIRVTSQEAYGPIDPKAFQEIPKDKIPPDVPLKKGTFVEARSPKGERALVKITEVKTDKVVIDFNHPLAGKDLEFQIEVVNVT